MDIFNRIFSFVFCLIFVLNNLDGKWVDESVWSEKLGEELWRFSRLITKHSEIKSKYTSLNATVKDGKTLLMDIKENVVRMLERKIGAVKCIADAAEELQRSVYFMDDFKLEYYNMKYSYAEGSNYSPTVPWELDDNTEYKNMTLEPNPSFYNIPINTNYSAVHIPTNVYDRYRHLAETITWSQDLDDVFLKNYHADPALSWQYFGSSNGMMRQYPAMQWNGAEDTVDLYDCRTRPWFIEAATCTKDIIILMDNSGSMTGMRNTIAKLVVNSLLKTFGNNDFINVLRFSWTAESVLPCYKDRLAQATPEAIKSFMEAVSHVKPEGNASFPNAFAYSLKLLEKYRESRNCDGESGGCNQAIMLVTDGLPGNVTEVFQNFNLNPNGVPLVRVFTFLVGTEVKGVQDLQLMACQNRGYYVHIHDLDEVHDQVLKYIPVIARPLVLRKNEHPVVWTHAFADVNVSTSYPAATAVFGIKTTSLSCPCGNPGLEVACLKCEVSSRVDPKLTRWLWKVMKNREQENRLLRHLSIKAQYFSMQREDSKYVQKITQNQGEEKEIEHQEYRLMTSVSMPAFDTKERNETKTAELLGVAGTDIPIDHLYSLTYPYKTGTNGYAFIVTHNGYLLLHPELRPVYEGTLKLNYDSVDLAEVEFLDDENTYKEYNPTILEMREAMVNQEEKEFINKMAKFHYDDMQRVGVEKRNFYVTPLSGTPFSIGLAIPSDFADYRIRSGFKSNTNETVENIRVDKYLKKEKEEERDLEWSIHPDWIYCKYHFPTFKKFENLEDELLHFLEKMQEDDWEWNQQYPQNAVRDSCEVPELAEDSYYCDQDLMELLMVDAQILESFRKPKLPKNSFETKLLDTYNPNLRFVATQSGLTKWQLVPKPKPGEEVESDFVKAFPRAIDEPWYRMAVLQNQVDEESFVFSIPFKAVEGEERHVIATHAIFHKKTHEGKKAPAAVLGYRFEQTSFFNRFMEITSETDRFTLPCHSDARECYVLDHNGYIVVSSKDVNETGRFFGEFEGSVMAEMIQLKIFEEKLIYDYQALCIEEVAISNDASFLLRMPLAWSRSLFHFIFIDVFWNIIHHFLIQSFNMDWVHSLQIDDDDSREFKEYDSDEDFSEDDFFQIEKEEILNATIRIERNTWPCDKNKTLYLLQQHIFSEKHIYGVRQNSSRFRFANRIPHTNLLLVVINTLYPSYEGEELSVEPNTLPPEECRGSNVMHLPRRRLSNCISYHPEEVEVDACGGGVYVRSNILTVIFSIFLIIGCVFC